MICGALVDMELSEYMKYLDVSRIHEVDNESFDGLFCCIVITQSQIGNLISLTFLLKSVHVSLNARLDYTVFQLMFTVIL